MSAFVFVSVYDWLISNIALRCVLLYGGSGASLVSGTAVVMVEAGTRIKDVIEIMMIVMMILNTPVMVKPNLLSFWFPFSFLTQSALSMKPHLWVVLVPRMRKQSQKPFELLISSLLFSPTQSAQCEAFSKFYFSPGSRLRAFNPGKVSMINLFNKIRLNGVICVKHWTFYILSLKSG